MTTDADERVPADVRGIFELESHGPDVWVGDSPAYPWGRIYGGLVVAQALWAATQTVRPEHAVHSLHAYFILGGDLSEPVRYEVDRVRNGRSFTTRRVAARQSGGAILTLGCSFQVQESGPQAQSAVFPADLPSPESLAMEWDAGAQRAEAPPGDGLPGSRVWTRYPLPLGEDPRLHACALAYLSDMNPINAVSASHPVGIPEETWDETVMAASLDHALWFHRPLRADDWLLMDLTGHGLIGSRGLATGPVFDGAGSHVATIAQEALLRERPAKGSA